MPPFTVIGALSYIPMIYEQLHDVMIVCACLALLRGLATRHIQHIFQSILSQCPLNTPLYLTVCPYMPTGCHTAHLLSRRLGYVLRTFLKQ
jgi:hypothetical protein